MAQIADFTHRDILALQDTVRASLKDCDCLQHASQRVTDNLWEAFEDSAVLIRCFITLPFERLPPEDKVFVERLAETTDRTNILHAETTVLSLMGTRGLEDGWNNRETSQGHRGIPLLSAPFITAIPMLARLLQEIGVDTDWFDNEQQRQHSIEMKTGVGQVGIFFVQDAAEAADTWGRPIISAQEFVREYGVRTVFGLGGAFAEGTILTLLVFTREELSRETVDAFTHFIVLMKAATADLLRSGAFFT